MLRWDLFDQKHTAKANSIGLPIGLDAVHKRLHTGRDVNEKAAVDVASNLM